MVQNKSAEERQNNFQKKVFQTRDFDEKPSAVSNSNTPSDSKPDPKVKELEDKLSLKEKEVSALLRQVADLKGTLKITLSKPILAYWDTRGLCQGIRF